MRHVDPGAVSKRRCVVNQNWIMIRSRVFYVVVIVLMLSIAVVVADLVFKHFWNWIRIYPVFGKEKMTVVSIGVSE